MAKRRPVLAIAVLLALGALVVIGYPYVSATTPTQSTGEGIPPGATPAMIEYVHDGDTVFLADGRKVRLLGINTPEIGDDRECYGDEATAALRQLLPDGTSVWVFSDVEPLDQYGRSLLFIYTDDATNINLEMLELGVAEVEMYAPNLLFEKEIWDAANAARSAGLGLWSAC